MTTPEPLDLDAIRHRLKALETNPDGLAVALAATDIECLLAGMERLRADLAEMRDLHEAASNLHANAERLLAEARADRDRLRPVVEKALEWRAMRRGTPTKPKPESAALIEAVDALEVPW